jgi:hypothetical protein
MSDQLADLMLRNLQEVWFGWQRSNQLDSAPSDALEVLKMFQRPTETTSYIGFTLSLQAGSQGFESRHVH